MQLSGAVVDLLDVQGSSVMVCLEEGWDITSQVSILIFEIRLFHPQANLMTYSSDVHHNNNKNKRVFLHFPVYLLYICGNEISFAIIDTDQLITIEGLSSIEGENSDNSKFIALIFIL